MKALSLSIAVFFASTCFAQTKTTAPPLKTMKAQLAQAQADLQASELARVELESKNKVLESKNKELEASNAELKQKMDEIRNAAAELLKVDALRFTRAKVQLPFRRRTKPRCPTESSKFTPATIQQCAGAL